MYCSSIPTLACTYAFFKYPCSSVMHYSSMLTLFIRGVMVLDFLVQDSANAKNCPDSRIAKMIEFKHFPID